MSARRDEILQLIQEKGTCRVSYLARRLGVSQVTVRRDVEALEVAGQVRRGHGLVTAVETADAAAGTSSPRPHTPKAARSSTVTHQPLIGMLVPSVASYYAEVVRGARSALAAAGGRLMLGVTNYRAEEEHAEIDRLLDGGVEGLLFTPTWAQGIPDPDEALNQAVTDPRVPTVLVERRGLLGTASTALDWVCTDHAHGSYLAVGHLLELGHSHVALLARSSPTAAQLRTGYEATLQRCGLTVPATTYVESAGDPTSEFPERVEQLLDAVERGGVSAAIVHGDVEAVLMAQRAADRGLQVPEDLAIVAYDDDIAGVSDLPLTAIAPPKFAVGWVATRVLLGRIEAMRRGGDALPVQHLSLQPELRRRRSS